MSWQERIERYLAEQKDADQKVQEDAERLKREAEEAAKPEQLRKLGVLKEKVPPLLDVLEQLNCKTILTQIRDEIWRIGEVSIEPDINNLATDTPIAASAILRAEWPCYRYGYTTGSEYSGDEEYYPPSIATHEEVLSINAIYGKIFKEEIDRFKVLYDPSCKDVVLIVLQGEIWWGKIEECEPREHYWYFEPDCVIEMDSIEKAAQSLEKILIKDCLGISPHQFRDERIAAVRELLEKSVSDDRFRAQYKHELKRIAKEHGLSTWFFLNKLLEGKL